MSAAPAPALQKTTAEPQLLRQITAAELKQRCPKLESNYTQVIKEFHHLLGKIGGTEFKLVYLIIERTYGAAGRPSWCAIPASEAAGILRCSVDEVEPAFRSLTKAGAIVAMLKGKQKVYSLVPENWANLPDLALRKKAPAMAEDSHQVDDLLAEDSHQVDDLPVADPNPRYQAPPPVPLEAGQRSKRYKLSNGREWECWNELPGPAAILVSDDPEGPLKIRLQPLQFKAASGDEKAKQRNGKEIAPKADRRSGLRLSIDSTTDNKGLSKTVTNHTQYLEPTAESINRMEEFLTRWFPGLGPPDDHLVRQAVLNLGSGNVEDAARRLQQRTRGRRELTWGFVLAVIGDVGKVAGKALKEEGRPGERDREQFRKNHPEEYKRLKAEGAI